MTIEIENLSFKAIIGLLDFERVKKQRVVVNLKASYLYEDGEFINYVDICKIIKKTIKKEKFELLEDAIGSIESKIISKYPNIEHLYIKISKPDILKDCTVSLSSNYYSSDYQPS